MQPLSAPEPASRVAPRLTQSAYGFEQLALNWRFLQAFEHGSSCFPVHRALRFAARMNLDELYDRLAFGLEWRAHRLDSSSIVLDSPGLLVSVRGIRRAHYCSCFAGLWADSPARAEDARRAILDQAGEERVHDPMFSIRWCFRSGAKLLSADIEEMADDVLHDEAYPELHGGLALFIERYLGSPETVLVLQGPPGTGKTRLVRAILASISLRKGEQAQALYTADMKALEDDEIFVKFITGDDDLLVIEDADYCLKPRSEGNEGMHRFLAVADGVVRPQGRKIIFTTNLPDLADLDEALVRPGRCFARIELRPLSAAEAASLLKRLCHDDAERRARSLSRLIPQDERAGYSLAEVYKAYFDSSAAGVADPSETGSATAPAKPIASVHE